MSEEFEYKFCPTDAIINGKDYTWWSSADTKKAAEKKLAEADKFDLDAKVEQVNSHFCLYLKKTEIKKAPEEIKKEIPDVKLECSCKEV